MIADALKLRGRDDPQTDILQLVACWLRDEASGRWFMILDNADDAALWVDQSHPRSVITAGELAAMAGALLDLIPQVHHGSILITSRTEDVAVRLTGNHKNIVAVKAMDEGQALALLRRKLISSFDEKDGAELVHALDCMPLAITQAAGYINRLGPRSSVPKYLNQLRKSDMSKANLLNRDAGDLRRDPRVSNSIITTWQISFEHIRGARPSAAGLLSLMSFFNHQGIPEFVLCEYVNSADGDPEEDRELEFEDDLATLRSYSLIVVDIAGHTFEMHRLVQFATGRWLESYGQLDLWRRRFLKIMSTTFPTGNFERWGVCQQLFPHAEVVGAQEPDDEDSLCEWSRILTNAAWYALAKGMYGIAEKAVKRAISARERTLGKEHLDTLLSVGILAVVLQGQGKYEAAEEMNRRVLEGREEASGKEHPGTLMSMSNLALVLRDQGKYEAAEEMNQRALKGREKALGKEHPDTLTSMSNLALVLRDQGKHEAAEEMNRRALKWRENALGKEHPDTLTSVSILAGVLQDQGKYEAADEMSRRALEGMEKALGKEHPGTLTSVSILARVLQKQGKYEAAEEMNRRALEGREKALGKEHPDTLTSVSNLALVLQYQGKYEAAEEMNRRALEGSEKILGKEHPDTLTSVYCLAYLLHKQKRYKLASELYHRAYTGYKEVLGLNHPTTVACGNHFSSMLQKIEKRRQLI
jgi:tetratricopeptide (TPR) repeat protein